VFSKFLSDLCQFDLQTSLSKFPKQIPKWNGITEDFESSDLRQRPGTGRRVLSSVGEFLGEGNAVGTSSDTLLLLPRIRSDRVAEVCPSSPRNQFRDDPKVFGASLRLCVPVHGVTVQEEEDRSVVWEPVTEPDEVILESCSRDPPNH
jgi:hypothetical protein